MSLMKGDKSWWIVLELSLFRTVGKYDRIRQTDIELKTYELKTFIPKLHDVRPAKTHNKSIKNQAKI